MSDPVVVLTRSEEENLRTAEAFEEVGIPTISLPMLEIADLDPVLPDDLDTSTSLTLLLTSSRGAERWRAFREGAGRDLSVASCMIVGDRSQAIIERIEPDLPIIASGSSVEDLQENVLAMPRQERGPTTILYPCSRIRRDQAVEGFRAMGFDVREMPVYEPVIPSRSIDRAPRVIADLAPGSVITFFSPSAVDNLVGTLPASSASSLAAHHLAAIGPTTAEALYRHGFENVVVADDATLEGVVDVVRRVISAG